MDHASLSELSRADLSRTIHSWTLPEMLSVEQLSDLRMLLSPDEVERVDHFHFAHLRAAFIANRGRLRVLLANYLECAPQEIRFEYGPQGKPSVVDADVNSATCGLTFNLSHTDGLAVVAVAQKVQLGVDVERIRDLPEMLDIARLHFSPSEYSELCETVPADQLKSFYACWTRKEAFLKGLGDGLNRPLDQFEVSFLRGQAAALRACEWEPSLCESWQISSLDLGDAYIGALAYEGSTSSECRAVQTFTFPEWTSLQT